MSEFKLDLNSYSTPKITGAGDSFKESSTVKRRVPVPSSRKFATRVRQDGNVKQRLKRAIDDIEKTTIRAQARLQKSSSVAEITPTKTKVKRRSVKSTDDSYVLATLATPRPFDETSVSRRCPREQPVCMLYQRLLLNAWRRSRAGVAALSDSIRRQNDQISQLELQVDVLRKLQQSESEKRREAQSETSQMKKNLDSTISENSTLHEKTLNLEVDLENTQNKLKNFQVEVKTLTDDLEKEKLLVRRKREENTGLLRKFSSSENTVGVLKNKLNEMEQKLMETEENLQIMENNYNTKLLENEELTKQLDSELDIKAELSKEVQVLKDRNAKFQNKIDDLQGRLLDCRHSYERINNDNSFMKKNLTEMAMQIDALKNKNWWENSKELATLSLLALHNAARTMLPAYL